MLLASPARSLGKWKGADHPPTRTVETVEKFFKEGGKGAAHAIYPAETLSRRLPFTTEDTVHWKYAANKESLTKAQQVYELPNARHWGFYGGSIIAKSGELMGEVSRDIYGLKRHEALLRWKLPQCIHLRGVTASVSTPQAASNYWHWTFDLLPRFHLLLKAGFTPDKVQHYLVNHNNLPFQLETFKALGIRCDQILRTDSATHYKTDLLVVPTLKGQQYDVESWQTDFLRSLPFQRDTTLPTFKRIYVSRNTSPFRRLTNEADIIPIVESRGFSFLRMEDFTWHQQRTLFEKAEVVLAPHGSGLTNTVYCAPGSKVIEIMCPQYVDLAFWAHGDPVGLNQGYLMGLGDVPPEGVDPVARAMDITVDPKKLSETLERWL